MRATHAARKVKAPANILNDGNAIRDCLSQFVAISLHPGGLYLPSGDTKVRLGGHSPNTAVALFFVI